MNKLFDKTGVMALGTRLRMLSEKVTKESEKIFALYDVDIKPKWYPVVYSLLEENPKTITKIAKDIEQSHVSVVKIVKEMNKAGLTIEKKDDKDKRKTNVFLTEDAHEKLKGLKYQHEDTTIAMEEMLSSMDNNLWLAINEFEDLFEKKSTYSRVLDVQRQREAKNIKVVNFDKNYSSIFKKLNKEWIEEYFFMEKKDEEILNDPEKNIIDKGGIILVALYKDSAIGVCSLIKAENKSYDFELSKMAVNKEFQKKGVGFILINEIIKKAKELNASSLYIETSSKLENAIKLYKKAGFKQIMNNNPSYKRSNYQMKLDLK